MQTALPGRGTSSAKMPPIVTMRPPVSTLLDSLIDRHDHLLCVCAVSLDRHRRAAM
jgi:hypothetical protein